MIFERALKELPGSYKLWYNYLKVIQFTACKFGECDIVGFYQINQIGSEEADEEQTVSYTHLTLPTTPYV